ncbi:MAG: NUDIX domain-containing protein [Alistipes sp.]|nr:NUDIX domain-containing protein [Alistipes sp.]
MNTLSSYRTTAAEQGLTVPIADDGSIRVWFAMRELRFATRPDPLAYVVPVEDASLVSRAKLITFLENYKTVVVLTPDPMAAFEAFAAQMVWVEAAGGAVENERGEVVMIRRNERWDLPKGHREQGELFAQCAAREAEEETGVKVNSVGRLLATTLHAYNLYGRWELKLTAWYAMQARDCTLHPQGEEGIVCAEWVSREEIASRIKNTFPTIKTVFEAFLGEE